MKYTLKCIINAIGGWNVPQDILPPHMKTPVDHLRGFEIPILPSQARPHVSHDPLRKDICGGTVATEERSPVLP